MTTQNEQKKILSTQGYRGTRDFYPEEQRIKSYLFSKIHQTLKSFGYEEYGGPFVEHLELYAAKSSEEIVREQLYSFKDKGDRLLAIRPEMTPTLARMVAAKQKELTKPIRWFSIPTCMRFERPQRGRLREFDQLNVDILGANSLDEDIEILLCSAAILTQLGASYSDFNIKINHRGIINSFLENIINLPAENKAPLLRLIDKKNKISAEQFKADILALNINENQFNLIVNFLQGDIDSTISMLGEHAQHAKELKERLVVLGNLTDSNCVQYAPDVMRGFDYYTGMVFELFDTHPDNPRALFGGGRYDNLVGAFGADEMPGVGFGMGDVTLTNFLETHSYLPNLSKGTDVCVLRFSEADRLDSLVLSQNLRKIGLNVECTVTLSKFGKQIQNAEKSGAKAVVFRGEDEIKNNTFSVKWLKLGTQEIFENNEESYLKFKEKVIHI